MTRGLTNCYLKVARHRPPPSRTAAMTSAKPNTDGTYLSVYLSIYRLASEIRGRRAMQILVGKVGYTTEIYHAFRANQRAWQDLDSVLRGRRGSSCCSLFDFRLSARYVTSSRVSIPRLFAVESRRGTNEMLFVEVGALTRKKGRSCAMNFCEFGNALTRWQARGAVLRCLLVQGFTSDRRFVRSPRKLPRESNFEKSTRTWPRDVLLFMALLTSIRANVEQWNSVVPLLRL